MNVYKFLFLNTFFCLICTGCVSRPPAPPIGGFQLKGKVAVEDSGERFSASFLWHQVGPEYDIDLWGPLGQGRVHLRGDSEWLAVVDGHGTVVRQGPRDGVMRAELGWSMPLDVLPVWVLGAPRQDLPADLLEYDAQGRLQTFTQLGWRVEFAQFREVQLSTERRWLPRRVDAYRVAYQAGVEDDPVAHRKAATRVRLIIADWQI